jgi:hypothetical protein
MMSETTTGHGPKLLPSSDLTAYYPTIFALILYIHAYVIRELPQVKFVTCFSLANLTCQDHYNFLPYTIRKRIDVMHNALSFYEGVLISP